MPKFRTLPSRIHKRSKASKARRLYWSKKRTMALANSSEVELQSDTSVSFTENYIKQDQPEQDCKNSIEGSMNYPTSEQRLNGADEECINNKKKTNTTVCDKDPLEEKPHVPELPVIKSELQSSECVLFIKNEEHEMKPCLKETMGIREKVETVLHDQIEIKDEPIDITQEVEAVLHEEIEMKDENEIADKQNEEAVDEVESRQTVDMTEFSQNEVEIPTVPSTTCDTPNQRCAPQKKIKRRDRPNSEKNDDARAAEACGILKSVSEEKDECSTYGDHIACKLRKFDDRVRAIVMHNMNSILFNAEMGMYNTDNHLIIIA